MLIVILIAVATAIHFVKTVFVKTVKKILKENIAKNAFLVVTGMQVLTNLAVNCAIAICMEI